MAYESLKQWIIDFEVALKKYASAYGKEIEYRNSSPRRTLPDSVRKDLDRAVFDTLRVQLKLILVAESMPAAQINSILTFYDKAPIRSAKEGKQILVWAANFINNVIKPLIPIGQ